MTAPDTQPMPRSGRRAMASVLVCAGLAVAAAVAIAAGSEGPFLKENEAAMERMMSAMNVKPTGDVDVDFAAMMIPHHQGAIDMAVAELRYGSNEQLRRIAQEIIVTQRQEIAAIRLAVGQPLPPSSPAPVPLGAPAQQPGHEHVHH